MAYVLIVESDPAARALLAEQCALAGVECLLAASMMDAQLLAARQRPAAALVEFDLPDGCGLELIDALHQGLGAPVPVAILARQARLESAVEALRRGAVDYLARPADPQRVQDFLARIPRTADLAQVSAQGCFGALAGIAPVMQTLYQHMTRVAPTEATVFLLGESGTGKEVVALTLHELSGRRRAPFLPVNCGAISPQLIESEIFGHEKGSFTGAERQHKGYFERAHGGSLFLDEITEMPPELQVKLLRVLETGSFMRIGSHQELETNVRIIAASNRDPVQAVNEGRLRLDLYHRLNVFPLAIPPLRERGEDIILLARRFLAELNATHGVQREFSAACLQALMGWHWPGNVRELRNAVQRAFILSDAIIDEQILAQPLESIEESCQSLAIPLGTSLAEADRQLIFATLERCAGVKKHAAQVLGISLKTLYNRLEEYGALLPQESQVA